MKRFLSILLAVLILVSSALCAFGVTLDYQGKEIKVGSLHNLNSDPKYSWLNKLVLRDSATAALTARIVPHDPYPYKRTFEEFMLDIADCMELYSFDTHTVTGNYETVVDLLYYTAVSMGMTTDKDTMLKHIQKKGIRIPVNMTPQEQIEAAIIYAADKYKLTYALFENDVTFTPGRSIDGAVVDVLAAAMGSTLPSGIDDIQALALYCCKAYAESYPDLPMSNSPDEDELFYLMEMLASNKAGYNVPIVQYDNATDVQKQYIDCTYYATVLDTIYDIHIDPLALAEAASKNDQEEIARLVLETMLTEKNVSFQNNEAIENLFTLACRSGCFNMDEEFYSDVFNYDVYVDENCQKLWVTTFPLASQLGGENQYLSVKLGDKSLKPEATTYFKLDPKKSEENMTITSSYNDGNGVVDASVYVFKIIKTEASETSDGVAGQIESMLSSVVPEGSEKANEIVSSVAEAAENIVSHGASAITPNTENTKKDESSTLETFAIEENSSSTTLPDLDYFSQLIGETYTERSYDLTSEYDKSSSKEEKQQNVFSAAADMIKDKPEVVIAPSSLIAAGALAGFLFTRRKKTPTDNSSDENKKDE